MRLKYGYLLAAALGLAACSQDIVRPDSGRTAYGESERETERESRHGLVREDAPEEWAPPR